MNKSQQARLVAQEVWLEPNVKLELLKVRARLSLHFLQRRVSWTVFLLRLNWSLSGRCSPGQEAQKIFKANQTMDATQVKTKLIGFGFSLLEGIDPTPENYVCAGIIHTKTIQVGCLLRLEPNLAAQVRWCPFIINKTMSVRLESIRLQSSRLFIAVYRIWIYSHSGKRVS